ncbi:MAG: 30S ribosomal protein S17 [Deltaproteobacteria bacterium]|nr:30S ribosomal protein S17 [Deltaproteobacteria bacterium]
MKQRGVRKKMIGVVIDKSMDKTAMVLVSTLKKHGTYKKYVRSQAKYMSHDPMNKCQVGDRVKIIESRPISKRKRWQVVEVLEKGREQSLENVSAEISGG